MARPKLGGESERLNMVISSEEMKQIEDWRFKNRVASKSEAIRRLCQIGVAFDQDSKLVEATSRKALRSLFGAASDLAAQRKKMDPDAQLKKAHLTLVALLDVNIELHEGILRLLHTEEALANHRTDLEAAMKLAAQIRESLNEGKEDLS